MSPKTGRPTNNPKISKVELRLSEKEKEMLNVCCEKTKLSKSDVLRKGIEKVYEELKK